MGEASLRRSPATPKPTVTMRENTILIINPNSTESMTSGLRPLVESLHFKDVCNLPYPGIPNLQVLHTDLLFTQSQHDFFTAPSGPKSINDENDAADSATHCLPALAPLLPHYDAFLVACYSQHPLVHILKAQDAIRNHGKAVTGIFEASVGTALQLIQPHEKFGIVSTGKVWEEILTDAVVALLGTGEDGGKRFAGVETTGLNATDLHDAPAEEVERRMKEAAKRLVRKGHVGAICLGCAGMSGMDTMVREACCEELGEAEGRRVRIVDGVQAGVAWLEGVVRSGI